MRVWALRHVATGQLMPQLRNRGYSFWNPGASPEAHREHGLMKPDTGIPRLFPSVAAARAAQVAWARGVFTRVSRPSAWGEWEDDVVLKPDGRTRADLALVALDLVEAPDA
jgi:hypothetical protein